MSIRYWARPVEEAALKELRVRDDAGREPVPYTDDEGGAPLRCCLRPSAAGERIVLVSYAPLRRWAAATGAEPGAYDEQGPVFVHAEDCGGPAGGAESYPFTRPGLQRTARRYSARGHILGGRVLDLGDDPEAVLGQALDEAFGDPQVALVHVRAAEFGCFQFEVRRP
ncbi:DUF1203 domain-containing protein [Streptomyces sp. NBC_00047]|uniref:DUF1203 domain-containing protein n=1 Tax=Streptomyces sp. NBC_00047 TaxID=2975627 RepID=UPI00224EF987|nr:DUF1203 domain-containing protein [Streptomyces sp. NBC_00047]MCX5607936.1 DUF1203 domain-containing protein [Streptomyces sp. NBC_00047]